MRIPCLICLIWNMIAYYGTRLINSGLPHHNMTMELDGKIPFLSWTVIIYVGFYILWIYNYLVAARQRKEEGYRFFSAEFLAKTVCLICFILIPTTNIRPEFSCNNIADYLMKWIYSADTPDNLFPSLHCMAAWFCVIAVRDNENVKTGYRIFTYLFTMAVFVSTLTTKQHVIVDVAAGIALAEICYQLTRLTGFEKAYRRLCESMETWFNDTFSGQKNRKNYNNIT